VVWFSVNNVGLRFLLSCDDDSDDRHLESGQAIWS